MKSRRFGWLAALVCGLVIGWSPGSFAAAAPDWDGIWNDFTAYAQEVRAEWEVPGLTVAVVYQDEVIREGAFGVKRADRPDEPVTVETVFQIGSISKSFTTTLVAMMVDEGHFGWRDRVVELDPEFAMKDPWVTREFMVYDLMAQHSGLPAYAADFQAFLGFDRDHIMASLRHLEPVSSFRSKFAYVNNLFLVAARLVERSTGRSWEANLEKRIFQPMGMTASGAGLEHLAQSGNRAAGHAKVDGRVSIRDVNWPYLDWVYTYGPAGGINANVLDMAQWIRLHINEGQFEGERLVSRESMNFMHTPHTIITAADAGPLPPETGPLQGRGMYYGQAWLAVETDYAPLVWHNGGTSGFATVAAFAPSEKLGVVVLTNLSGTTVPEILAQRLFDLYFGRQLVDYSQKALERREDQETATQPKAAVEPPRPPRPLAEYTGEYTNPVYATARVEKPDKGLTLTLGPEDYTARLVHVDGDRFKVSFEQLPEITGQVRFLTAETGRVEALAADFLADEANDGRFERIEADRDAHQ
jgi:CubicO group peptidase (beta-lactamase class C family)